MDRESRKIFAGILRKNPLWISRKLNAEPGERPAKIVFGDCEYRFKAHCLMCARRTLVFGLSLCRSGSVVYVCRFLSIKRENGTQHLFWHSAPPRQCVKRRVENIQDIAAYNIATVFQQPHHSRTGIGICASVKLQHPFLSRRHLYRLSR